jgi:inner membrane protein
MVRVVEGQTAPRATLQTVVLGRLARHTEVDVASAFSHAVAALGIGALFYRPEIPKRVWVIGAACAALPDLDVIGFRFGIAYGDALGHRGFSHSLVFAAALAALVVWVGFRRGVSGMRPTTLWAYLFLATASHGFLDAFTDGGLGVAFFAPMDNTRYFFPIRPIRVSPLTPRGFFSERGFAALRSELPWVWLPSALLAVLATAWRRLRQPA